MHKHVTMTVEGLVAGGSADTSSRPLTLSQSDVSAAAARMLASLKTERDRFLALAFCWADILVELDRDHRIVYATGAVQTLIGQSPLDLNGLPIASLVIDSDQEILGDLLAIARKRGRVDSAALHIAGVHAPSLRFGISGYQLDDLDGHYFIAFRYLDPGTAGSHAHAGRDEQSGLYTAQAFVDAVTRHLTLGNGWCQSQLVVLSLPGYDAFRQRLPKLAENELLRSIGTCLRASAIDGDSATRLADDRFGVILEVSDDGGQLMHRIREATQRIDPTHKGLLVESSRIPIDSRTIPGEDLARFVALTIRRFCNEDYVVGGPTDLAQDITQAVRQTMRTVGRMRQVITHADFSIAFQPIVCARSGVIHHYEALARFPSATGMKTPFENITFAESTGLISEFDLAMVRRIIDWYESRQPADAEVQVAVNLSGQSVSNPAFVDNLRGLLDAHANLRGKLMFEITESSALSDLESANAFIQQLRQQGFQTCLDDLGAGAANLSYLSLLQVDMVKIDGQAMQNARRSQLGRAFLAALLALCRDLGVKTVAEMVEDSETLDFVRDCGVNYVQGYLFSRPAPSIENLAGNIPRYLFSANGK